MEATPIIKPGRVALEVTGRCRFQCRHCRVNTQDQGVEDLDTETWKRILAAVASYTQCVVIFTGGEPLERSDLFDLLEHARHLGLRAVLATCGYRIDEAILQRLMDVGVLSLSLSLDGASAETHDKFHQAPGAFDAVMRTARLAQVAGIPFQITTTLNRMNQTEIIAIAGLIERLGAASFNPIILIPAGRGVDLSDQLLDPVEYETLLNELLSIKLHSKLEINVTCGPQFARVTRTRAEKRVGASSGCMGGRDFGFITRQGDVQTCGYLPIPAGNLIDNGYDFRYIWEDSAVLKTVRDRKQRKGKCSVCEHLEFCGGCRARAFLSSGDVLGEDPICTQ